MRTVGLIGREQEVRELRAAEASARRRRGGLVLVAGDAGIGKTALVEHAIDGRRATLLRGAARASGTAPFDPLVAAIRSHPRWPAIAHDALVRSGLTAAAWDAICSLFGELPPSGGARTTVARATESAAGGDPGATRDGVCRLIVQLARLDPLAIILDDLQRADNATIDALPDLARSAARETLLLVAMYRTDEIPRTSPVRRLRVELRRHGLLHEIVVEPLDGAHTAALVTRSLGARPDETLGQRLFDRSQGLPLFVEELSAALLADQAIAIADGVATLVRDDLPIPESLRDSILIRADGMAPVDRLAMAKAALLGDEVDATIVDELVEEDTDWRRAGLERGILVAQGDDKIAFRHGLVREVLLDDLPPAERRTQHRRIAGILIARGAEPLLVAEHWFRAGETDDGVDWLLKAAEASRRVHAYRDAASAYRRALDEDRGKLASPTDVIEHLAECLELSGGLSEAARTWETATAARAADDRPDLAGEDQRRRARVLEVQGRWVPAIEARLAAVAAFEAAGLPAEAATERLAAAAHLRSAADFTAALALLDLARAEAREAGRVDLEARTIGLQGNVLARMGRADDGLALVRRGLKLALDGGFTAAAAELFQRLADSLEHAGRYDPARSAYLEGADYCRTRAIEPTAQLCLACMAVVLWQTGQWSQAEQTSREVIGSADATQHAHAVAEGILGIVTALRGSTGRARQHLEASLQIARRIELAAMELISSWGLALCDRLDGDEAGALDRCRGLLARWERTEERHYVVPALRWAATVFAEHNDAAGIRACADALGRIAAQTAQPEAIAALASTLGEAASIEGEADAAAAHFASALEAISMRDLPLERAEIGRRGGVALVQAGRRAEGVAALVTAARTARRLGATPLGVRIAADLAGLGEPVERRLGSREAHRLADRGLTRRELEVIGRVADGLTSREIGRALFISPRTVEMHVGSALAKLDCRTRAEAVQRVATLGLLAR
jgi:DNA-binding CsgD family transcriptional regulator/tetratricopeptide (TPR) repeat protein